jgi:replication initiation and membrane attachment protein DnaB
MISAHFIFYLIFYRSKKWAKLQNKANQGGSFRDPEELNLMISIVNASYELAKESKNVVSSSVCETQFEELTADRTKTITHTQKHLLRSYPAGKVMQNIIANICIQFSQRCMKPTRL